MRDLSSRCTSISRMWAYHLVIRVSTFYPHSLFSQPLRSQKVTVCVHVQVRATRVPVVGVVKFGEQPNAANHQGGNVR